MLNSDLTMLGPIYSMTYHTRQLSPILRLTYSVAPPKLESEKCRRFLPHFYQFYQLYMYTCMLSLIQNFPIPNLRLLNSVSHAYAPSIVTRPAILGWGQLIEIWKWRNANVNLEKQEQFLLDNNFVTYMICAKRAKVSSAWRARDTTEVK